MKENVTLLLTFVKSKCTALLFFLLSGGVLLVLLPLYGAPVEAAFYALLLSAGAGLLLLSAEFLRWRRKHLLLSQMAELTCAEQLPESTSAERFAASLRTGDAPIAYLTPAVFREALPAPQTLLEADYQTLLLNLAGALSESESRSAEERQNQAGYYTLWIHQIKTPISAARLILKDAAADGTCSEGTAGEILEQLFRIEQYAEMALVYQRLGSGVSDFVFREYEIAPLVRAAVKKYAPLFIRKKLSVTIDVPEDLRVVTDEKWLSFVLEQILSNAVKYTERGGVSIFAKYTPECKACGMGDSTGGGMSDSAGGTDPGTGSGANCETDSAYFTAGSGLRTAGCALVIRDTGIGIDAADLPRICEKGFTGCNGRYDKHASGIGLYLSKQILEKLGNTVSFASEIGTGTTVTLGLSTGR